MSYGVTNPESGAQVLIALSALGVDFKTDERFIKNGHTVLDGIEKYRVTGGGYSHTAGGTANVNATLQVFCATVAYLRMARGSSSFYLLDGCDAENVAKLPASDDVNSGENNTVSGDIDETTATLPRYKLVLFTVFPILGVLLSLFLFLKKKSYKSYVALWLAVLLLMLFTGLTKFQSAEDYYGTNPQKKDAIGTVTLSIRCDTVVGKSDSEHIPADGVILAPTSFEIAAGDTVLDILNEAAQLHRIQVESDGGGELAYVVGIRYLYELDYGDLSGWVYRVNGETPAVGCGACELADGDVIEWFYTCNLGEDLK